MRMKLLRLLRSCSDLHCLRCTLKVGLFVFLYLMVMKLTLFKSVKTNTEEWSIEPDNYTQWMEPMIGTDKIPKDTVWREPDNATIMELEDRLNLVREVCKREQLSKLPINNKEFFVDHAHNLVWCNIFKAASSYWLYKLNILGGYDKTFLSKAIETPLTLARKKYPRPSVEALTDFMNTPGVISMLVVREPFVRLLSAFRDKLEQNNLPYYKNLVRVIIKHSRGSRSRYDREQKPTFKEFASYVIKAFYSKVLTFDEHWMPYYKFCSPCAVNFTVIAKVETLARDSAYVIHELGIGQVLGTKSSEQEVKIKSIRNKSRDGRKTAELIRDYFKQLDKETLDGLLKIYGPDFDLFGYDSSIYETYVQD